MNYEELVKFVPEEITEDSLWKMEAYRLCLLTQIIRLLITMIPQQRGYVLREQGIPYQTDQYSAQLDTAVNREALDNLLKNVPLP